MALYYWVGGSGTWDNSSNVHWSLSSGGAGGAGIPTTADSVSFDGNSGTAAVITVASTAACSTCIINKSDINVSLSANATLHASGSSIFDFVSGTLTLNSYTLKVWKFKSSYTSTRTIAFGTGKMQVEGGDSGSFYKIWDAGTLTGFSATGSLNVEISKNATTGQRYISHGYAAGGSASTALNFSVTAGSDSFTADGPLYVNNMSYSGYSGTIANIQMSIYGNFTLSATMTIGGGTQIATFLGSGTQTITSNGQTYDAPITVNGTANTVTLADNLAIGATRQLRLTNGTFDANNKNVTIGTFALSAGTKTLNMGSGTWTVAGATWNANTNVTGLTVNPSTATITMTSGSAKTFSGGGLTWPTLNQGGAGALTISQSNTFTNLTNTTQPATVTLTAGTTQKLTSFSLSGTAGNLITLNSSSAGTKAYLSAPYQTISMSYVAIQDVYFKGGAIWLAPTTSGNVDNGGNFGVSFSGSSGIVARYNQRKAKVIPGI